MRIPLFARAARRRNAYIKEMTDRNLIVGKADDEPEEKPEENSDYNTIFALHMLRYLGQTVTVFVMGGGASGRGFTGVLISADKTCVRLITVMGPAPACPLGNACMYRGIHGGAPRPYLFARPGIKIGTVGSVTVVPIDKIVSFVHNQV